MADHPTASAAVVDAIERICFDMIMGPNGRSDGMRKLKFFFGMIDNRKQVVQFGRLGNLIGMAGIAACSRTTIDEGERNIMPVFESGDWDSFLENFEDCRDKMVRQDATVFVPLLLNKAMYNGIQEEHEVVENSDTNDELDSSPIFQQQYLDTITVCQLQQVLSIIRPCILGDGDTDESAAAEALDMIKSYFRDDDGYRNYLLSFFEKAESGKTLPELKPLEELREILDSRKDLSVARCIKKCDQLIQSMCQEVFGENMPLPFVPGSTRKDQRRRSATVKRPLPESEDDNDDEDLPSLETKKSSRKRIRTNRFVDEYSTIGSGKNPVLKRIKKSNSTKSTPVRMLHGLELEKSPTAERKRMRKPIQRLDAKYATLSSGKTWEFPSGVVEKEIDEDSSVEKAAVRNNDNIEGGQSDGDESGDENKDDNASFVGNNDDSDDDASDPGNESEKEGDVEERLIEQYLEAKTNSAAAITPAVEERFLEEYAGTDSTAPGTPAPAEGTAGRQRPVLATPEPHESLESMLGPVKPAAKKRLKWTEKETTAVKCGVRKFGEGNWVQIRDMFPTVLGKRTNVNIKDKWRILTKNGATG